MKVGRGKHSCPIIALMFKEWERETGPQRSPLKSFLIREKYSAYYYMEAQYFASMIFLCVPGTVNSAKVQHKMNLRPCQCSLPKGKCAYRPTDTLCLLNWEQPRFCTFNDLRCLFGYYCVYMYMRETERERQKHTHTHGNRDREREKGVSREREREGDAISKMSSLDVWVLLFAEWDATSWSWEYFSLLSVILPHL